MSLFSKSHRQETVPAMFNSDKTSLHFVGLYLCHIKRSLKAMETNYAFLLDNYEREKCNI
jgi:hypothetical protein